MIVYELMTDGHIVRLPDLISIGDIPKEGDPLVILLMPYNRALVGFRQGGAYEKWLWGKPGEDNTFWRESFLYDDVPCRFDTGDTIITIGGEVSTKLRSELLRQLPPPGNHGNTMSILKGFLSATSLFDEEDSWDDEDLLLSSLSGMGEFRLLYWGVRKALSLGDHSMVGRIKIWARRGIDVFREEPVLPKMWVSVGDLPGNKGIAELEALLFKPDQLKRMNAEKSGSVVFRGDSGYLVRFEGQRPFGEIPVSVWMYFPFYMWEEMKDRRGLRPQEIVILSWGYLDALEATEDMERYMLPVSLEEPIKVDG